MKKTLIALVSCIVLPVSAWAGDCSSQKGCKECSDCSACCQNATVTDAKSQSDKKQQASSNKSDQGAKKEEKKG